MKYIGIEYHNQYLIATIMNSIKMILNGKVQTVRESYKFKDAVNEFKTLINRKSH